MIKLINLDERISFILNSKIVSEKLNGENEEYVAKAILSIAIKSAYNSIKPVSDIGIKVEKDISILL